MILNLGCIVEGHGEVAAVPLLLRRIRQELKPELDLRIRKPPWRVPRTQLVKPGVLENKVELLARQLAPPRCILILVDADDDCPKDLGPALLERAQTARPDIPCGVVLAKREYEAWFLASLESLGGRCGLPQDLSEVDEPESIRGAKEFIGERMVGSRNYSPTADQPALTALFDMQLARQRSGSFDKLWRELERLLGTARENAP